MTDPSPPPAERRRISLLSANIQAGASTRGYGDYVTRSWSNVLPHREKRSNLDALADLAAAFDVVGLQETDPGSLRSGFLNQTHYLAERAGFPFWSHQPNRRVGRIASSANGLLSRHEPDEVLDYALPSRIPGRGVLLARYGRDEDALTVAIAHLSLSPRARAAQIAFLSELLAGPGHAVLMGDFNCECDAAEMHGLYRHTSLRPPEERVLTFPSWQPKRAIDHILVSEGIDVHRRWVLPGLLSDHLALAAELELPAARGAATQ
ncbi:endonuclease/exonuclease/phosphatase family protein [Chiayiivirga flava]|uniref:Endonuclease/exonuclease/phosphatase family metal-dependent hydrolase n=1 Tax=Chiayiivirga flava TaxID=659595 RepID=A0A7W8D6M4_9GAMM|nr:endonuclease/exonuclease/phosphatase family protein [Chiayiivirga flava]MBB5208901.1 endonuclease/exonuclease/phosphatase family metal-dependent hydrolase [Chiayiivirga flava]